MSIESELEVKYLTKLLTNSRRKKEKIGAYKQVTDKFVAAKAVAEKRVQGFTRGVESMLMVYAQTLQTRDAEIIKLKEFVVDSEMKAQNTEYERDRVGACLQQSQDRQNEKQSVVSHMQTSAFFEMDVDVYLWMQSTQYSQTFNKTFEG